MPLQNRFLAPPPEEPQKPKRQCTQYKRWTDDEEKQLVQLWAEKHPKLDSKDARKAWQEIVRELSEKLGSNKSQEQYIHMYNKMQYLIAKYKEANDWNKNQTGGDRKTSSYYEEEEEINEVLGCRDVMTFRHVVKSGPTRDEDEESSLVGTNIQWRKQTTC